MKLYSCDWRLEWCAADSGERIAAEHLDRIVERFGLPFKLRKTPVRAHRGLEPASASPACRYGDLVAPKVGVADSRSSAALGMPVLVAARLDWVNVS